MPLSGHGCGQASLIEASLVCDTCDEARPLGRDLGCRFNAWIREMTARVMARAQGHECPMVPIYDSVPCRQGDMAVQGILQIGWVEIGPAENPVRDSVP